MPVGSVVTVLAAGIDVLPFGVVVGAEDVVTAVDVLAGVVDGAEDVVGIVVD